MLLRQVGSNRNKKNNYHSDDEGKYEKTGEEKKDQQLAVFEPTNSAPRHLFCRCANTAALAWPKLAFKDRRISNS